MNDEEYQDIIGQKDVLDHTTLNVTLKELASRKETVLAEKVKGILERNKISKPGPAPKAFDTSPNYYRVDLSSEDIEKILDVFFQLEESHLGADGEPSPTAAFYAALADKWDRLTW